MLKFLFKCLPITFINIQSGVIGFILKSIILFTEWMYISDWRLDAIIRLNKLTGGDEKTIVREGQTNRLYGVKIYSEHEQAMLEVHPCMFNNGGCQKMCFAIPLTTKNPIGLKVNLVLLLSLYSSLMF